jgi:predicted DNA-binding transcriptional regulator YafY
MVHSPNTASSRRSSGPAALRRILHINSRLADGGQVSAAKLAEELEVSVRTIKRDIEILRHEHGAEILWEPAAGSYSCTNASEHLPLLRISADEAIAVALAGRTFSAWGGSPLGRALKTALGKVAQVVGNTVSIPATTVADCIFQPDDPAADATGRHLGRLVGAIHRRLAVRIAYRKPGSAAAKERLIHPLHMAYLDHDWMLVAFDPTHNDLRNFLLTRIEELHHTGRPFQPPANFDPKQHLAGAFGRHVGGGPLREVRLRFDAYAAPFIRERRWHPSQTIEDAANSEIVVSLRISHLLDVQRWVLSWGSHAEALAPKELRDSIAHEIVALSPRYATEPSRPQPVGHSVAHPL